MQIGKGDMVGVDVVTAWQADVAKPIQALAISTYGDATGLWQFTNYDCKSSVRLVFFVETRATFVFHHI